MKIQLFLNQGVLVCLSVFLLLPGLGNAQKGNVLMIGEKAPKVEVHEWVKGESFTECQPDKVYLLEFGATWCKPCKAVMPHLTALSKKYNGALSVNGFFIQENMDPDIAYNKHVDRVKQYVSDMGDNMNYNVGVDGPNGELHRAWGSAANQTGVPHAFIVDKSGRIAWMGYPGSEMDSVLARVIGDEYDLKAAAEAYRKKLEGIIDYDSSKPFLVDGNGGDDTDFMFRSVLSKWRPGIHKGAGFNIFFIRDYSSLGDDQKDHLLTRSVQVIGYPLTKLYFMAYNDRLNTYPTDPMDSVTSYGKLWPRVLLEVSDMQPFVEEWGSKTTDNHYNYSLIVPKEKASNTFLQSVMRRDLQSYFGYQVTMEKREMPVWHLRAGKDVAKLLKRGPKGGYGIKYQGKEVKINTDALVANVFSSSRGKVVINSTGVGYGIDKSVLKDFNSARKKIEARKEKANLDNLNTVLKRHGLYLEEGTHEMRVIVIRDPKPLESAHSDQFKGDTNT